MTTFDEVADWCAGAIEAYGDPSVPVCQLFFRYLTDLDTCTGDALACAMVATDLVLVCGPLFPPLPLRVQVGEPDVTDEEVLTYGLAKITTGVWALAPSLNVTGLIHAFVVIHGVPDPAPWERRIVLP